jgi:hypothetical protein
MRNVARPLATLLAVTGIVLAMVAVAVHVHRDHAGGRPTADAAVAHAAVSAVPVRTGQAWTVGQGQAQDEASVVKLDILETLLAQHRASGTALSAQDESLAEAMIEDSDNNAATALWYQVGGAAAIRSFNASVGLTHTMPSSCVDCPGFPWPGWSLTTTTPADQLLLLGIDGDWQVNSIGWVSGDGRDYLIAVLSTGNPTEQYGIDTINELSAMTWDQMR